MSKAVVLRLSVLLSVCARFMGTLSGVRAEEVHYANIGWWTVVHRQFGNLNGCNAGSRFTDQTLVEFVWQEGGILTGTWRWSTDRDRDRWQSQQAASLNNGQWRSGVGRGYVDFLRQYLLTKRSGRGVCSRAGVLAAALLLVGCAVGLDFLHPAAPELAGYTKEPLAPRTSSADAAAMASSATARARASAAGWSAGSAARSEARSAGYRAAARLFIVLGQDAAFVCNFIRI